MLLIRIIGLAALGTGFLAFCGYQLYSAAFLGGLLSPLRRTSRWITRENPIRFWLAVAFWFACLLLLAAGFVAAARYQFTDRRAVLAFKRRLKEIASRSRNRREGTEVTRTPPSSPR